MKKIGEYSSCERIYAEDYETLSNYEMAFLT